MGTLIAIEGLDGAGKNTLTRSLVAQWSGAGLTVAARSFPRYGESIHADLAAEALRGEHGDTAASVYGMGLLFALDRAAARDLITDDLASHDVVLLDRYVASAAAFSAARLGQDATGDAVRWVGALEFDRLGLPRPNLQVLLDVPVAVAAARAESREAADPSRARDLYERDGDLQARTGAVYRALAAQRWASQWLVLTPDVTNPAGAVSDAAGLTRGL